MAEAVGLVASIVTLVGSATYIQSKLNDFRKGAEERKQLLASVVTLKSILDDLRSSYIVRQANGLSEEWFDVVKPLKQSGVFQRIEDIFSEIKVKLEPKSTLNRLIAQVSWPFVKEDVDRNIRQMRDLSADVSFVLQDVALKLAIVTGNRITQMDARERKREQIQILDWLSSMKFIQQQEIESQQATIGTCDWFILSEPYVAWRSRQNRFLYCKAIGGAGKTVLASKVFDDLRHFTAGQKCGVFIIYCKYDQPDTHNTDKIAAALLRQSIQIRGVIDEKLQTFLDEFYYEEKAVPSTEHYLAQLKDYLKEFESLFVIVDGLDEIKSDGSRLAMIKFIAELRPDVSVMFTSRPIAAIDNAFNAWVPPSDGDPVDDKDGKEQLCQQCNQQLDTLHAVCRLCDAQLCKKCPDTSTGCVKQGAAHDTHVQLSATILDVSARTPAIRTYVRVRIEQSAQLRKWIQRRPGLSKQIENKVAEVAQQMFLLARLHMDAIADPDLLKESDFDDALQNLPTRLEASYEKAMDRVDKYGRMLLQIITCARRPLNIAEIEHAIGINTVDGTLRDGDIIPVTVLISRCAGLVTIDAKNYVIFAHYTFADYFWNEKQNIFHNGQADLAAQCLAYLELPAFSRGAELSRHEGSAYNNRLQQFPFLDYAAIYWASHVQACADETFNNRSLALIRNGGCLASIVQALWYSTDSETSGWRKRTDAQPLELAIFFKFRWLFDELLRRGSEDWKDSRFRLTPLMLAAQAGDVDLTRRVLEMPSSINATDADNETALSLAIKNEHEEVAKLLIDQPGLDVNMKTGVGEQLWTPLINALCWEQTGIFKRLLQHPDIDVNVTVRQKLSALHYAIYQEDEDAFKALIALGKSDLNNEARSNFVPLHVAAEEGQLEMVRMLLDAGADINSRDIGSNGTALMRAADYGHLAVARLLVERGIDWDARDVFDRHALHSAAINREAEVAEYLLQATKIDVNLQDVHGVTPLHDAAWVKESETVEVLIRYGARTDLVNQRGLTPLDVAQRVRGASKNVSLMLGTNENTNDTKTLETLLDAAEFGDASDVTAVLATLTNTAVRDQALREVDVWLGRNALHHVIQRLTDSVQELCDAGAELDTQDKYGRTPLHIAAMLGRTNTTRFLLEKGCRTDLRDRWDCVALKAAYDRRKGWTSVVLVELGSPIESNVDVQWLLNQAAWQGNLIAAKRLVKAGARVDMKLSNGMSPYEYAKEEGHQELAEYLDNVGREAPTVRFEETSTTEKIVFETADEPPNIETTEDGQIKRLKRTGTDEIRMEQGQALEDDAEEFLPPNILKRVMPALPYWRIGLACMVVLLCAMLAMLNLRTGLPIYGGQYVDATIRRLGF